MSDDKSRGGDVVVVCNKCTLVPNKWLRILLGLFAVVVGKRSGRITFMLVSTRAIRHFTRPLQALTFVRVHQRVDHVHQVAHVVQCEPQYGHLVVDLPEHRPADNEYQIVDDRQRDER